MEIVAITMWCGCGDIRMATEEVATIRKIIIVSMGIIMLVKFVNVTFPI